MPRRTITLAALLILLSGAAIAVAAISENTGVALNATVSLTGPTAGGGTLCKTVTNNSPTGKQVYVPGSTSEEWQSFIANKPTGVTLGSCGPAYTKYVVLISGSSWTVPTDWNSSNNRIEAIGGGGGGRNTIHTLQSGGGGGAYSAITNVALTPGTVISYQIGSAGAPGNTGGNGGDSWFSNTSVLLAKGGTGASTVAGGAGGQASAGVGTTKFSGGNGGTGMANNRGGGGGAAAGPNGNGGAGGTTAGNAGHSGGGGANGGANGAPATYSGGGAGGNNRFGAGGGAAGNPTDGSDGVNGGGGGGNGPAGGAGGAGSQENLWTDNSGGPNNGVTVGPGGGNGSGDAKYSTPHPATGYGNGGAGVSSVPTLYNANGRPGLIVITYGP